MRFSFVLFCQGLLFLASVPALASGLRNIEDGWLIPTRELVHVLKQEVPSGLVSDNWKPGPGVWVTTGTMQMFCMPELPVKLLGLGVRLGGPASSWNISGKWQRTGDGYFLSDLQSFALGWEKSWRSCVLVERRSWVIGFEPLPAWVGLTFLWETPPVSIGIFKLRSEFRFPLWASSDWRQQNVRQSRYKLSISGKKMVLVGGLDKKSAMGWALGLELAVALSSGVGASVRCDPDTGSLGPGTLWMWGRFLIKTSHVVHPELGVTHRITLTAGALGAVPW